MSQRYEADPNLPVNSERFGYEEVVFLLDLCEKHEIMRQSQTKGYSLVRAFTPIHREMKSAGYNRSLTQVIYKFRKIKLRFMHAYQSAQKGNRSLASRFEHYKRFEKMLSNANIDVDASINKNLKKKKRFNHEDSWNNCVKYEDDSGNTFDDDNTMDKNLSMQETESDIIEKEDHLDDEFIEEDAEYDKEHDDDNKFLSKSDSQKNLTPGERTVTLLETLVPNFKKAQQELQTQFFKQQRELQRQQQEWEEKILDEEREFFTKILSSVNLQRQS